MLPVCGEAAGWRENDNNTADNGRGVCIANSLHRRNYVEHIRELGNETPAAPSFS